MEGNFSFERHDVAKGCSSLTGNCHPEFPDLQSLFAIANSQDLAFQPDRKLRDPTGRRCGCVFYHRRHPKFDVLKRPVMSDLLSALKGVWPQPASSMAIRQIPNMRVAMCDLHEFRGRGYGVVRTP